MNTTPLLTVAAIASFVSITGSAQAYNGFVSDIRAGEHPYETRKIEQNIQKRIAKEEAEFSYSRFDNPAYFHPIYAKKSVLHPFYRKGGTTRITDNRFARWHGYQDPDLAKALSPDTYCTNFTFAKVGGTTHGQPVGYQCF